MRRAKEKGIEAQRLKPLIPTRAVYALIGEEEQAEKRRENIDYKHIHGEGKSADFVAGDLWINTV